MKNELYISILPWKINQWNNLNKVQIARSFWLASILQSEKYRRISPKMNDKIKAFSKKKKRREKDEIGSLYVHQCPKTMPAKKFRKNPNLHVQFFNCIHCQEYNKAGAISSKIKIQRTHAPNHLEMEKQCILVSGAHRLLVRSCEGDDRLISPIKWKETKAEPFGRDIFRSNRELAGARSKRRLRCRDDTTMEKWRFAGEAKRWRTPSEPQSLFAMERQKKGLRKPLR